jgi:hypothetical protein
MNGLQAAGRPEPTLLALIAGVTAMGITMVCMMAFAGTMCYCVIDGYMFWRHGPDYMKKLDAHSLV